jgi:hypothetical protein
LEKTKFGNMPKEIAIYLNLLYSRADTGFFFRRTLPILLVMLQLVMGIIIIV